MISVLFVKFDVLLTGGFTMTGSAACKSEIDMFTDGFVS